MTAAPTVRPIAEADRDACRPLRAGYDAFRDRAGPPAIRQTLWTRFLEPDEPEAVLATSVSACIGAPFEARPLGHRAQRGA